MRYLKTIILFAFLMSLSSLTSEAISSFSDKLQKIEKALLHSLKALDGQERKVTLLEAQLKEAGESSWSFAEKIARLERSLTEAKSQVAALRQTVKELEAESKRLLESSGTLEKTIQENEESHLANLEKVRKAHLAETFKIRIGGWVKFGIGIALGIGTTYLIVRLINITR